MKLWGPFDRVLNRVIERAHPFSNFSSYSQEGEDLILSRKLDLSRPGFYVDVGAHHPLRFSNTALFYAHGWRGINIDPNPGSKTLFDRHRPEDINLEVGVGETPGELEFFEFKERALSTFDPDRAQHLEKTTAYRRKQVVKVPVRRLDEIFAKYQVPKNFDFLSIDVENLEIQVLKSNSWGNFLPKNVMIETFDFDIENPQISNVHKFMKDVGYRLWARTHRSNFETAR